MFGWAASAFCRTPLFRGKQRVFRILFRFLPYKFARSLYGVKMARNLSDMTYRFCMLGSYGKFVSDVVSSSARPFAFIDIGANQGIFSLIAGKNTACTSVIAFEPNPETFSFLVSNIEANDLRGTVAAFCGAIAPEGEELITLYTSERHSGGANLLGRGEPAFTALRISKSVLKTLFSKVSHHPVVVKIDVEGAEEQVLQALEEAELLSQIDSIVVEVSELTSTGGSTSSLRSFLDERGWREVSRSPGSNHYDALFKLVAEMN